MKSKTVKKVCLCSRQLLVSFSLCEVRSLFLSLTFCISVEIILSLSVELVYSLSLCGACFLSLSLYDELKICWTGKKDLFIQ